MGKRGHFQAFVEAEDGSVLRVIGPRTKRSKAIIKADIARKVRNAATMRQERDEDREWKRTAHDLRGALVVEVLND